MMNRTEMLRPSDIEARLPIPTDQKVRDVLRSKIEHVRNNVEERARRGVPTDYRISEQLFSFTGEEFSLLKGLADLEDDGYPKTIGRVESDRLQRLGFAVMKEYGFNENNPRSTYGSGSWPKDGVTDFWTGTSSELKSYPSQTIDCLVFHRIREFITATGETMSVSWSVADNTPLPFRSK